MLSWLIALVLLSLFPLVLAVCPAGTLPAVVTVGVVRAAPRRPSMRADSDVAIKCARDAARNGRAEDEEWHRHAEGAECGDGGRAGSGGAGLAGGAGRTGGRSRFPNRNAKALRPNRGEIDFNLRRRRIRPPHGQPPVRPRLDDESTFSTQDVTCSIHSTTVARLGGGLHHGVESDRRADPLGQAFASLEGIHEDAIVRVAQGHIVLQVQPVVGLQVDLAPQVLAFRATGTAAPRGPFARRTTRLPSSCATPTQMETPSGLSLILSSDDVTWR